MREGETQRGVEGGREGGREKVIHTHIQRERERQRETERDKRQRDRERQETERQRDRETEQKIKTVVAFGTPLSPWARVSTLIGKLSSNSLVRLQMRAWKERTEEEGIQRDRTDGTER